MHVAHHKPAWHAQLSQWLANPLVVTVVAALLGGWLIPQITRKWQDHERALEIRSNLVTEMSESVSSTVVTGRFVAAGLFTNASDDPYADQKAFNDAYRTWSTDSASIGAKLEAYFAGSDLGAEWRSFADVVTDFVQLSTSVDETREARVRRIFAYKQLPRDADLDGKARRVLATSSSSPAFHDAYLELGSVILQRRDELVHDVLHTGVSGF